MLNLLLNVPIGQGILETVIYADIGIAMAILAFKIVDWITPGKMAKKIAQEGNP